MEEGPGLSGLSGLDQDKREEEKRGGWKGGRVEEGPGLSGLSGLDQDKREEEKRGGWKAEVGGVEGWKRGRGV